MLTCALFVMPGVHCGEIAVSFLGPLLVSEVGRAKVYPYRALVFGDLPFFVKKSRTRRGPAKGFRWNDLFGFAILHPMEIKNATFKRRNGLGKREAAVQNNVLSSFVSHAFSSRR